MSQSISQAQCAPPENVIMHLYHTAAAMEHLAGTLPEGMDGLAHLIGKLGKNVEFCAILLDDARQMQKTRENENPALI
ncbi:hypothetical protein [Desulfovibrio sp. 86]|uniref:Uncharacterized protein n=1 Tax=uncultured Desulfovibrio sp. TaxID=167968 RepID=A0A212L256_9BACT|nr:hypothetical protein [Desulfovibrio sp. 86]SCM71633.1 conserved hypothetical protein [uncultured Desulfovibrio sp.]VZH32993.1 conserved protein of unknown function [Desulfovibrio sp. 86]